MRFLSISLFAISLTAAAQSLTSPAPGADPSATTVAAAGPAPAPGPEPAPPADGQYEHSGNILRLSFSERLKSWDWNAEFSVPFLLGLPSQATAPAPQGALGFGSNYYSNNHAEQNTAMIFPRQLYVHF